MLGVFHGFSCRFPIVFLWAVFVLRMSALYTTDSQSDDVWVSEMKLLVSFRESVSFSDKIVDINTWKCRIESFNHWKITDAFK